jgi:hypothetical protein
MKTVFSIFLCLAFFFAFPINLTSQGYLHVDGKSIVDGNGENFILRGMGLGGWMLQEGYMLKTTGFAGAQYQIRETIEQLIGKDDTDAFYDAWLNNHVRKIDIDSLKSWGFNSVRLPMHYNLYTLPIEEEPVWGENTWLNKGFEMTDSLISWCKQNEMYVILDLHAAPGGQGMDQGISDYDPSKPSLWESQFNQNKTIALWKRLAERYADEPWVAGYDLLNETNWTMSNNGPLRFLYGQITDSIRAVDQNHIIFIEGNWFANDFTGLTPPWDNNMVYSPHKYWSYNDQASIQWVLNIRDQHNVPLYLGESGENSNVWFRDAIDLLEQHNIGWAWWPMKKIQDIAGPLSIILNPDYQTLLNYWNGSGQQPNALFAKAALMELTENLKIENCIYQKDVIDAMFRQIDSKEAVPFRTQEIPGVVFASDYDLGRQGSAYSDVDTANYHVSSGNYTAWNKGWAYRNDGVDVEISQDQTNTNGYNIGWTEPGEWAQYAIDVTESGVFDVHVRAAGGDFGGAFYFSDGKSELGRRAYVPNTGGYQNWETVILPNIVLTPEDQKIRFHVEGAGANYGSFEFIKKGETTSILADYVSAFTSGFSTVQLNLNKRMMQSLPTTPAGFRILVNGLDVPVTNVQINTANHRALKISVDHEFLQGEVIKISYEGTQVNAADGTDLNQFNIKPVQNTVEFITSVEDLNDKIQLQLYPNPVHDQVSVRGVFAAPVSFEISVVHLNGQIIQRKIRPEAIEFHEQIDLSSIPNGIHFLRVQSSDGNSYLKKFVKE